MESINTLSELECFGNVGKCIEIVSFSENEFTNILTIENSYFSQNTDTVLYNDGKFFSIIIKECLFENQSHNSYGLWKLIF